MKEQLNDLELEQVTGGIIIVLDDTDEGIIIVIDEGDEGRFQRGPRRRSA